MKDINCNLFMLYRKERIKRNNVEVSEKQICFQRWLVEWPREWRYRLSGYFHPYGKSPAMIQAINIPPNRPSLVGTAAGLMPPLFQHPNSRVAQPPPCLPCLPDRLVYSYIVWDRHGSCFFAFFLGVSIRHANPIISWESRQFMLAYHFCLVSNSGLRRFMVSWYSWAANGFKGFPAEGPRLDGGRDPNRLDDAHILGVILEYRVEGISRA